MPKNYLHAYDCQQSFLDKKKEVNCVVHFVVDLVVHELKLQIHALKAKNICLVYIFFYRCHILSSCPAHDFHSLRIKNPKDEHALY